MVARCKSQLDPGMPWAWVYVSGNGLLCFAWGLLHWKEGCLGCGDGHDRLEAL